MTDPAPATSRPTRRHDLDALRGVAMVLGIVLHSALSFLPGFWPAVDATASFDGPYDEILHAIHGFRMPLFFLLSGFFTAMLWRRRGLGSLLKQRALRIGLPLALGMVTIIPAVHAASEWAVGNRVSDYLEESGDIWAAAFLGEERAVEALIDRGVAPDARRPDDGQTPLHMAAVTGEDGVARVLLNRGADPGARAADGTPVEFAVFFGNAGVADLLVAAGADDPRPPGGEWEDVFFWDEGGDLLESEDVGLESWLSSFHHLWFLWFLIWLVAGFALVAAVSDRIWGRRDRPGRRSGWIMWLLIPLTMIPQLMMGDGGAAPHFGPETSTGVLPQPHVLGYYAVFFAFGALLYGRRDRSGTELVDRVTGPWTALLPVALLLLFPLALHLTFDPEGRAWGPASLVQVGYAWAMIGGSMAVFRVALHRERRGVRFLSDSAYWLYLAHVPLVIVLQSSIRSWDLPSGIKFTGLVAVTTGVLLVSYRYLVRYTPIGTLLNGERARPGSEPITPTAS